MRKLIFFIAVTASLYSCDQSDENVIQQGRLQLAFTENSISNLTDGKILDEVPTAAVITISSENGAVVLENEKISVIKFDDYYLLDPILLSVGYYSIDKFLILNEATEVIYATPVEGSALASLVENPLSIQFGINSDEVTNIDLEVIATNSVDPEDLGYSSLVFNIVPTIDILVSVFEAIEPENGYYFIESVLTVYGDGDSLFTIPLGDSINVVRLRNDYDEYLFKATNLEGVSASKMVTSENLEYYRTTPIDIIIQVESVVSTGLFTLIDGNLVKINQSTGDILKVIPIFNFPFEETHSAMTFNSDEHAFYLIQNTSENPTLVKINENGQYSIIGPIMFNGSQVELAEALTYDNNSNTMYLSASLNGGVDIGDFYSESLLTINTTTAEATFLTTIITNEINFPDSDTDDLDFRDGTLYFVNGQPPGANFTKIYSIEVDLLNINGTTEPDLNYSTDYISGVRITIDNDLLYLTGNRSLYSLNLNSPISHELIGNTHSESDFNGSTIRGVVFVE